MNRQVTIKGTDLIINVLQDYIYDKTIALNESTNEDNKVQYLKDITSAKIGLVRLGCEQF
jgi:uncharacterized protein (DUF1015 family)